MSPPPPRWPRPEPQIPAAGASSPAPTSCLWAQPQRASFSARKLHLPRGSILLTAYSTRVTCLLSLPSSQLFAWLCFFFLPQLFFPQVSTQLAPRSQVTSISLVSSERPLGLSPLLSFWIRDENAYPSGPEPVFSATWSLHSYSALLVVGLPWWLSDNEAACSARDPGSVPGLGRSPGGGHRNSLQYSCLENPHGQRSLVGYSPKGRKRVRHDWSNLTCTLCVRILRERQ